MWPRQDHADWGRHVYRELNAEADALASKHTYTYVEHDADSDYNCFRLFFDGSCTKHAAGGGWILYGAAQVNADEVEEWTKLAEMSFPLCRQSTVTIAELEACLWGVAYMLARLQGRTSLAHHLDAWRPLNTKNFEILDLSGLIQ